MPFLPIYPEPLDDPNRLYDDEPISEMIYDTAIGTYDVEDSTDFIRDAYLNLMRNNVIPFKNYFTGIGNSIVDVIESKCKEQDNSKSISVKIGEKKIIIPGNKMHMFCFYNIFTKEENRPMLEAFHNIISNEINHIPISSHYLIDNNDGKRSRATSIILVINEITSISFLIIRGWQMLPNIIIRTEDMSIPDESQNKSLIC